MKREYKNTRLGLLAVIFGITSFIFSMPIENILIVQILRLICFFTAVIAGLISSGKGDKTGDIGVGIGAISLILYVILNI